MLGKKYLEVMSHCVALMPGCDRECGVSKTSRRKLGGTYPSRDIAKESGGCGWNGYLLEAE